MSGGSSKNFCSVFKCKNRLRPMYRFPSVKKGIDRFEKWVNAAANPCYQYLSAQQIYQRGYLCSRHFAPDDFIPYTKRLKPTAIPSLELGPEHKFKKFSVYQNSTLRAESQPIGIHHQIDLPSSEIDINGLLVENSDFFLQIQSFPVDMMSSIPLNQPSLVGSALNSTINEIDGTKDSIQELFQSNSEEVNDVSLTSKELQSEETNTKNSKITSIEKPEIHSLSALVFGDISVKEVCRICLCSIENCDSTNRESEETRNMLKLILPDLNQSLCSHNVYCGRCVELLTHAYQLRETWIASENRLQKLIKEKNEARTENRSDHCYNKAPEAVIPLRETESNLFCGSLDPEKSTLIQGLPTKIKEKLNPGPFQCDKCGRFYDFSKFRRHQYLHGRIRVKPKSICPVCDQLVSATNITKHIEKHYETKKRENINFQCPRCNKMFTTKQGVNTHVNHFHLKQYKQCHICGKTLLSRSLRNHIKTHAGQKRHECNICQKRFLFRANLRKHLRSHNKEKMCSCQYCGKLIKYEQSLIRHIRVFHVVGGVYECEFCNKPFARSTNLQSHKRKKHACTPNADVSKVIVELSGS